MNIEQIQEILANRLFQILVSACAAAWISFTAIPVIITISRLKNLMDEPGDRSSHEVKTPTLGGVAIFASVLVSYFLWENPDGGSLIHLTIASIVTLFFLGIKDDILILSPKKKIFVQIATSALVVVGANLRIESLFGIFGVHEIPYFISIGLTIFIFIALINAINLIDGIDGLAGGICMIASSLFGVWFYLNKHYALACMAAGIAGSLVGFLRYNYSRTQRIFMGDTGSMILGFLLTMFAVKFIQLNVSYIFDPKAYFSAPILAIVVLIVPIFDTLRVFIIRINKGKSPFVGDRNHLHHILIDSGLTHLQASSVLYSLTLVSVSLFLLLDKMLSNTQALFVLAGLFVTYMWSSHLLKLQNERRVLARERTTSTASDTKYKKEKMMPSASEILIEEGFSWKN